MRSDETVSECLARNVLPSSKIGKENCIEWVAWVDRDGYGRTKIGKKKIFVHRLLMEDTFHFKIPDGYCVMHSCDNPPCVNIDHLSIGTTALNNADKASKGRAPKGNDNPSRRRPECLVRGEQSVQAKLTEKQVLEIRKIGNTLTHKDTAEIYGVYKSTISKILAGRTWKHLLK